MTRNPDRPADDGRVPAGPSVAVDRPAPLDLPSQRRSPGRPVEEKHPRPSGSDGRIPLVMRMGITGHRWADVSDPAARQAVAAAFADVSARCADRSTPSTSVTTAVVSSLAEGADRLAADWAVSAGARLEVVLPLPPEEYAVDFAEDASRAHFSELLGAAATVTVLPEQETREAAYRAAGEAIVQRSDVLVAVWDGDDARGEGGTADIVRAAAGLRVPLYWLRAEHPDDGPASFRPVDVGDADVADLRPVPMTVRLLSEPAFRLLDRYNRARVPPPSTPPLGRFDDSTARTLSVLYHRADRMAVRARKSLLLASRLLYSLAVVAVGVAAGQLVFLPDRTWPIWGELGALVLILCILLVGRRSRLLDRWLSIRMLAERLRSSYFLALIGASPTLGTVQTDAEAPSSATEWTGRALREALLSAAAGTRHDIDLEGGRTELLTRWIDVQLEYQGGVVTGAKRRHRISHLVTLALFSLSLVAALMHVLEVQPENAPEYWTYISVVVPAAAAAVGGYSEQREYARQHLRAGRLVQRLGQGRDSLRRAQSLTELRRAAEAVDLVIQGESADWFAASRLHELTVP